MSLDKQVGKDGSIVALTNSLGTAPIGKLLLKYSLPAITANLVTALYGVLDRIFVGRGIGEDALGGISLSMVAMSVGTALGALFGLGSANLISIYLGRHEEKEAENTWAHAFWLLVITGSLLLFFGVVFVDRILILSGGQVDSQIFPLARRFTRIVMLGSVFLTLAVGMSHIIRSQGFPTISMVGMLLGSAVNVIAAPLFIFVLHWDVEGAALATVIAQFASMLFFIVFMYQKRDILHIHLLSIHPSIRVIRKIFVYGAQQGIVQFAAVFIFVIFNFSIYRYAAGSLGVDNGGDIVLSGMNVIGVLIMLIYQPVYGVAQAAQPLIGYNYGARNFTRVKKVYKRAILASSSICLFGMLLFLIFPTQIIGIFVPDASAEFFSFSVRALRIATVSLPFIGYQIVSSYLFASTERPKTSFFLASLRQIILLIPIIIVAGYFFGVYGIMTASPLADMISCIPTAIMIYFEMKRLRE
ncbi:MAG: MATE family efflux transporter [Clostridiales Family XIII bacterium]|jgi:putative MATE family efflux protein|nr:MATE family efflux transporter [Clostridiales Family XIII bacterium]